MTIAFEQKVDFLGRALGSVVSFAGSVGKNIAKMPWLLALFVLLVVGLLYTIVAYLPLLISRFAIIRVTNSIIRNIHLLEQRDAMLMHADIESIRKGLDRNAREIKVFFVFKPLFNEIARITIQYKRLENAFFKVAYPEYNQDLTRDEENELLNAFAGWKDDEDEHELHLKTH